MIFERAPRLANIVADVHTRPTARQKPTHRSQYSKKDGPSRSEDFARIFSLPTRDPHEIEGAHGVALQRLAREQYGRDVGGCECPKTGRACILELKPIQAALLYEIEIAGGCIASVGVGHGKTIAGILAPLARPEIKNAVILVPPGLVAQLVAEYQLLKNHWRVPSLISHHPPVPFASRITGAPTLHILPYSKLSRPDSTIWLEKVAPDLIVADECDLLRNPKTATTSRVLRYFRGHPTTLFVGWTGSLSDKSIADYAHLSALALKKKSPLPLDDATLSSWAAIIDPPPIGTKKVPTNPGALLEFCEPGEHVRSGFRNRLISTRGFVATDTPSVNIPLRINRRAPPPIPDQINLMLAGVRETWTRPDGEEFTNPLDVSRCLRELACGLFYRWKFPRGEDVETITQWLEVRKAWNKELRFKLLSRAEHLDSEHLCTLAAMRFHGDLSSTDELPSWDSEIWPAWREVKDSVRPDTEAVRVSDYLICDAAEWASSHVGIVWYETDDFGVWLSEITGLHKHGGGVHAGDLIKAEKGENSIIASVKAHGRGRDGLQFLFSDQLVVQPFSSSKLWEQALGRLHRQGQKADEVNCNVYTHTIELEKHLQAALSRASYVSDTLGAHQKITEGFAV